MSLQTLAFLVVWILMWDDELDEAGEPFGRDMTAAQGFRDQTLHFIRQSLASVDTETWRVIDLDYFIARFRPIGDALRQRYDRGESSCPNNKHCLAPILMNGRASRYPDEAD
jgi:hypothetical protein